MENFHRVKIEIFIPGEYIERLRDALSQVNVGHIGNYDHCISVTSVTGYWRPLAGANPYAGQVGQITSGSEYKVEVNAAHADIPAAIKVIRQIHPYEEPVINVIPLANHLFE